MSGWGYHAFDNDAACDFLTDVVLDPGGEQLMLEVLHYVHQRGGDVDSDLAKCAIAAAELIAIACGKPRLSEPGQRVSEAESDVSGLSLSEDFLQNQVQPFCESIPKEQVEEGRRLALEVLKVVLREDADFAQNWRASKFYYDVWHSLQDLAARLR